MSLVDILCLHTTCAERFFSFPRLIVTLLLDPSRVRWLNILPEFFCTNDDSRFAAPFPSLPALKTPRPRPPPLDRRLSDTSFSRPYASPNFHTCRPAAPSFPQQLAPQPALVKKVLPLVGNDFRTLFPFHERTPLEMPIFFLVSSHPPVILPIRAFLFCAPLGDRIFFPGVGCVVVYALWNFTPIQPSSFSLNPPDSPRKIF